MKLQIKPGFYLTAAFLLLMLPLKWVLALAVSIAVHELAHMGMICLCGGKTEAVELGPAGANIQVYGLNPAGEWLSALAGPVSGLLLACLGGRFPRLTLCALGHSIFNLLPVYPLDGGRAIRSFLLWLLGERGAAISEGISTAALVTVALGGIYCCMTLSLGLLPVLAASWVLIRLFREKFLANRPA